MEPYQQASVELNKGIPNLLSLTHREAMIEIDEFCKTWTSPALSFNPYRYYLMAKHIKSYPIYKECGSSKE